MLCFIQVRFIIYNYILKYVYSNKLYITTFLYRSPIDLGELDCGTVAKTVFPSPSDLSNFNVFVSPDSGFWKGATYKFTFCIPSDYPHKPPKVKQETHNFKHTLYIYIHTYIYILL